MNKKKYRGFCIVCTNNFRAGAILFFLLLLVIMSVISEKYELRWTGGYFLIGWFLMLLALGYWRKSFCDKYCSGDEPPEFGSGYQRPDI